MQPFERHPRRPHVVTVRVSDEELAALDALVRDRAAASRADVLRDGLAALARRDQRETVKRPGR
jgi:Arc/MetJ-type ribon-helix-helix transcriptional regulator